MKVAHLADLHVGFRQYDRTTTGGQNAREIDVAIALRRVVDDLIAQRPDLVLIAGDVFHSVRPTNGAILTLFSQLQRLRQTLPDTRVIAIAGNHDTPRSSDTAFILPLYQTLGVDIVLLEPQALALPGATVVAVPSAAAGRIPPVPAGPGLKILLLHADVVGYGGASSRTAFVGRDLDPATLAGWDYVALGDYHVCAQVGPRAWYAGAIEYTSTDAWGELKKQAELGVPGKGYLLVDLPGGTPTFRPIGPTRRFVELPPIEATGLGAEALDAAIADRVAELGDLEGAVVRLVVCEVTRDVKRALNMAALRTWRGQALHFQLELRRAEHEISPAARAARFQTIDEQLAQFLGQRPLAPDVDRAALVQAGLEYFHATGLDPSCDPYTGLRVPGVGAAP